MKNLFPNDQSFLRRTLILFGLGIAVVIAAWFVWTAIDGLLLIFFAIIVAVALDGLARLLRRVLPIPRHLAVILCVLLVAVLLGAGFTMGGMNVTARAPQLQHQMAQSIDRISQSLEQNALTENLVSQSSQKGKQEDNGSSSLPSAGQHFTTRISDVLSVTVDTLADIFVIVVVGIYLALQPSLYRDPLIRLFLPRQRRHILDISARIGVTLRRWLVGRGIAMVSVGVLTAAGLYALGIQFPFLLGLIAGLLTFVPYLGAIVSAIPAILVAVLHGLHAVFFVVCLYLAAHILEGYILMPLVQKRAVSIPPAFLLISQTLGGVIAGILGIMLATPIALVIAVIVQLEYVQDIMGGTPHLPGQQPALQDDESADSET